MTKEHKLLMLHGMALLMWCLLYFTGHSAESNAWLAATFVIWALRISNGRD